ncbi:MAG: DNA adenine methylase [Christensenellaceae bacterium]
MKHIQLKPFIKWAGGKGQLLKDIESTYPAGLEKEITKYAEPFVGGGAVLFDIISNFDLDEVYISDTNAELINAYRIIKGNVDALIKLLYVMQQEYIPLDIEARKVYYGRQRQHFNDLKIMDNEKLNIEKAALFIFLNKTCFNGLYRVNRRGLFNVPMGAYKKPCICNEINLRNISIALQKVIIVCGDYKESEEFIDKHTFVYLDPPYRPLSETASFTSYTENIFDDKAQIELANYVAHLDRKGAKIVISNSDPKNTNAADDFFDELYKKHNVSRVQATRMINCNGESRGKISELLIVNY